MDEPKWSIVKEEGKVTEHTLVIGHTLCRFWGEHLPPEAELLLVVAKLYQVAIDISNRVL